MITPSKQSFHFTNYREVLAEPTTASVGSILLASLGKKVLLVDMDVTE